MPTKFCGKRRQGARRVQPSKPGGVIHPRVEAVGPQRFGIVSVDWRKATNASHAISFRTQYS